MRSAPLRPSRLAMLRFLAVSGPLSQADIARGMGVTAGYVSQNIDELIAAGMVKRAKAGRRSYAISLTADGSARAAEGMDATHGH